MAATVPDAEPLRRGERVVAAKDLRGVPAGTTGWVLLVTGLTWTRYRVRFDNGVEIGSLDRKFLEKAPR